MHEKQKSPVCLNQRNLNSGKWLHRWWKSRGKKPAAAAATHSPRPRLVGAAATEEVQGLLGRLPQERGGGAPTLTLPPFAANTELMREPACFAPKIRSGAGSGWGVAAKANSPRIVMHTSTQFQFYPRNKRIITTNVLSLNKHSVDFQVVWFWHRRGFHSSLFIFILLLFFLTSQKG